MYEFQVKLTYGIHHVFADDYSVAGGFYIFWVGIVNVRMFPANEVINVVRLGNAPTEKPA